MVKNQYIRCKELLQLETKEKLTYSELSKLIMFNLGSSQNTIKSNIKVMLETGLIKIDNMGSYIIIR